MQSIDSTGKPPKAIFLMGGAGSGKGAIRGHIVDDHPQRNYRIIDPDLIKEKLPQYKTAVAKGTSSREAHVLSMEKAEMELKDAVKNKVNFIFDSTGSNSYLYKTQMMEALKQGMAPRTTAGIRRAMQCRAGKERRKLQKDRGSHSQQS